MLLRYLLFRSQWKHLKKMPPICNFITLFGWLALFIVIHWMLIWHFEPLNCFDSLWLTLITFSTVGYGDVSASTVAGKLTTMILGVGGGIALLATLFSGFFEAKQFTKNLRRYGKMKNPFKNCYVILNFPGQSIFEEYVKEIRHVEENAKFCVVDDRIEELPSMIVDESCIHFVKGSLIQRETYEAAGLKNSKVVIIFPTNPGVSDSDAATKTIVELIDEYVEVTTRIIHVLVDRKNEWMFKKTRSVQILETFEILAIVQECQDVYSSKIVERLFLNTEGANPHTVQPRRVVGWTWSEFVKKVAQISEEYDYPLNVLSLVIDGEPDSCPSPKTVIGKNDYISIIAYNSFNWDYVESKMVA